MRRQLDGGEVAGGNVDAGGALQKCRQRFRQRLVARRPGLDKRMREIRRRHEVAALRLGQAADQFGHLVGEQAGHQPFAAGRRQRVQHRQRQLQGDAVGLVAGDEAVFELVPLRRDFERGGKRLRIQARTADHHVIQRPAQRGLLGGARLAVPGIQRAAAGDAFG